MQRLWLVTLHVGYAVAPLTLAVEEANEALATTKAKRAAEQLAGRVMVQAVYEVTALRRICPSEPSLAAGNLGGT